MQLVYIILENVNSLHSLGWYYRLKSGFGEPNFDEWQMPGTGCWLRFGYRWIEWYYVLNKMRHNELNVVTNKFFTFRNIVFLKSNLEPVFKVEYLVPILMVLDSLSLEMLGMKLLTSTTHILKTVTYIDRIREVLSNNCCSRIERML